MKIKIIRKSMLLKPTSIGLVCVLIFQIVTPTITFALTSGPSTPEIQSFEPVGTTQLVDPFTGDFNYNIPLLDVGGYPINLHYHAGIGMDQEASWVGLGWNINPGVINRSIRGLPDDYNGDEIKYEYNEKNNANYELRFIKNRKKEIFGFGKKDKDGLRNNKVYSNEPGFTFTYNNQKGIGYSIKKNLEFKNKGQNTPYQLGIGYSNNSGYDISLGYQKKINKSTYKGEFSYNSRNGLEKFSFNKKSEKKGIPIENNLLIPFSNSYYTSSPKPNFSSSTFNVSITTGEANVGILKGKSSYNLNYQNKYIQDVDKKFNKNGYGFLYTHNAREENELDKLNSGGYGFDEFSMHLGISTHAYDMFDVSGQGNSGQFRPMRNQIGLIWNAGRKYISENNDNNFNFELAKNKSGKLDIQVGTDIKFEHDWGSYGKIKSNKANKEWVGEQNFEGDFNNLEESVFFKDINDVTFLNEDYFDKQQGFNAVLVDVSDIVSSFPTLSPSYYYDKYSTFSQTESSIDLSGDIIKDNKRQKRSNIIQCLNGKQAQVYNSKTASVYTNSNSYTDYDYSSINENHIAEITTLGQDGSRYVYGIPAINKTHKDKTFSVETVNYDNENNLVLYSEQDRTIENSKGTSNFYQSTEKPKYTYAYQLTAILSPDYADITGDGPTPDDFGQYTKFNYQKLSDRKWRAPYVNATLNKNQFSNKNDDMASYLYGEKDIWVLKTIETKTHVAFFETSGRRDALGPKFEDNFSTNNEIVDESNYLQKLDRILLYSINQVEMIKNNGTTTLQILQNSTPIKVVNFEYSYDLCKNVINHSKNPFNSAIHDHPLKNYNLGGVDNYDRNLNEYKGKLTLHKVYFTYGNSTKAALSPYLFEYNENTEYKMNSMDRWGTYSPNLSADGSQPNNYSSIAEFPYTRQNNKVQTDIYASMFNLSKIYTPSGAKINIEYESDDYAFVQDKKAMQMIKVVGFVEDKADEFNKVTNELHKGTKPLTNIIFEMEDNANIEDYIPLIYNKEFGDLYFNMLVDLSPLDASKRNAKEYITGYCKVQSSGFYKNHNGKNYGYINVESISTEDDLTTKQVTPKYIHPVSGASFQYIKQEMPWLVYHGSDWKNSNESNAGKAVGTLLSFLPELVKTITGFNSYLRMMGYANKVDLNYSFIRLYNPKMSKLGGGHRVKSIKINDNWNSMSGEDSHTYGQVYSYTRLEDNKEISSGVAAYEPIIGGDENPFRQPQYRRIKQKLIQDNYLYDEYPIAEELFPSAIVGYSKVKVRDLKPSDLNSNLSVENHHTGYTEQEFYTLKDFPTKVSSTKLQKYFFNPSNLSYVGVNISRGIATQGTSIILNDMHGKLKSESIYDNKGKLISKINLEYNVKNNKLNNKVLKLEKGKTLNEGVLGVDIETIIEPLESKAYNVQTSAELNSKVLDFGAIKTFALTLIPNMKFNYEETKTVSVSKIITVKGILKKIITMDNGSTLSKENLLWDDETGEVILTKEETEFKNEFNYNYHMPAYLAYKGMEGAYKNINATFKATVNNGKVSFPEQFMLTKGDELLVETTLNSFNLNYTDKAWVLDDDQTMLEATLIKSNGEKYPNGQYAFKVIRSGYRNMQSLPVANYTLIENPINNNNFSLNYDKVINASAIEYSDKKQIYPFLNNFIIKDCGSNLTGFEFEFESDGNVPARTLGYLYDGNSSLNSYVPEKFMPSSTSYYNPYALALRGVYNPSKSYTFYNKINSERTTSVNLNNSNPNFNESRSKSDGLIQGFVPFWSNVNNTPYWEPYNVNSNNDEVTDKWVWTNHPDIIDPNGMSIQNTNALGIKNSYLFGFNKEFLIAEANNASHSNILFESFEEYKPNDFLNCNNPNNLNSTFKYYISQPWHWYLWPNLTKDRSGINVTNSHSGNQSLEVKSGIVEVPFKLLPNSNTSNNGLLSQFFLNTNDVIQNFYPTHNKSYLFDFWTKYNKNEGRPKILLQYWSSSNNKWININSEDLTNEKLWIDGWCKSTLKFNVPAIASNSEMRLIIYKELITISNNLVSIVTNPTSNQLNNFKLYIDDIRIMPVESNMNCYVYNNVTNKLMAKLDDNHFTTFYEYDDEGLLVRTKIETEKGIRTIQESRSNFIKK